MKLTILSIIILSDQFLDGEEQSQTDFLQDKSDLGSKWGLLSCLEAYHKQGVLLG